MVADLALLQNLPDFSKSLLAL